MDKKTNQFNFIKTSVERRKKDGIFMRMMTILMIFFLTITLLFMDNASEYQIQTNYKSYGEWLLRTPAINKVKSPYLESAGEIWKGGSIYCLSGKKQMSQKNRFINPADSSLMTGKNIGAISAQMIKQGHIKLKQGRFPEKDNEILMEESALAAVNSTCKVGENVSFYVAVDDDTVKLILENKKLKLYKVTYKLVGIIGEYSSLWNGGENLPNAFVTKESFENLNMTKTYYAFQSIRKKYMNGNTYHFADSLMGSIQKKIKDKLPDGEKFNEMGYAVNSFAYGNTFFSEKKIYRNMTYILVMLGSMVMAYIMSVYFSKRKKFYLRLIEIGSDRKKVFKISLYECTYYVLPSVLISLISFYLISAIIVYAVAKISGIEYFFVFKWKTLFLILACFALVFIMAFVFSWVMFGNRHITEKKENYSVYSYWRLRKRAKKGKKLNVYEYETRRKICSPMKFFFIRMIGIGVCVCVFVCFVQINSKVKSYKSICVANKDFIAEVGAENFEIIEAKVPAKKHMDDSVGKIIDYVYVGEGTQKVYMKDIFSNEFMKFISNLKGIKKAEYTLWDESHIFSWTGKTNADYYKNHQAEEAVYIDSSTELGKKYAVQYDSLMYKGIYYKDTKDIWDIVKNRIDKKSADYDSFDNGDEVLLFEQKYNMGDSADLDDSAGGGEESFNDNSHNVNKTETGFDKSLKKGDVLTIKTKEKDIKVKVGDILPIEDYDFIGLGDSKPYIIAGSRKLEEKIAKQDKVKAGFNHVKIDFSRISDTAAVDKILERKCENLNYKSEENYKEINKAFKSMAKETITYGTFIAIITIIYIFILVCILYEEYGSMKKRRKLLKKFGVQEKEFTKAALLNGFKEAAYILLSIPAVYIFYGISFILKWKKEYAQQYGSAVSSFDYVDIEYITSYFFNKKIFELTERNYVFYNLIDVADIYTAGMFFAVMFLVVLIIHYIFGKGEKVWKK